MGSIFWIIFSFFTFCLGLIVGTVVKKRDAKLNEFNKKSEEWWNDTTVVKDEDFFNSAVDDDFFTNKKAKAPKKPKGIKITYSDKSGNGTSSGQVVMGSAYKEIRKMIKKIYGINVTNDRQFNEIKRRLDRNK